jgi:hypothetical protein
VANQQSRHHPVQLDLNEEHCELRYTTPLRETKSESGRNKRVPVQCSGPTMRSQCRSTCRSHKMPRTDEEKKSARERGHRGCRQNAPNLTTHTRPSFFAKNVLAVDAECRQADVMVLWKHSQRRCIAFPAVPRGLVPEEYGIQSPSTFIAPIQKTALHSTKKFSRCRQGSRKTCRRPLHTVL